MSGSLNRVQLIGNLTRDVEIRHTNDGRAICNIGLATNETWKEKNTGHPKERVEYHRIAIFNENLGRIAQQYLKKGSRIYIEGQLQTRDWTDKDGVKKYVTEVVLQRYSGELIMLGERESQDDDAQEPEPNSMGGGDLSDEIPFRAETR